MYCIYSGKYLKDEEMNIEHIIPLSLGGSDEFTIMVGREINCDLGSKVDGKFCNDFLIMLEQLPYENKGHSQKEKKINLKVKVNDHAATWSLSKNSSQLYDHIDKKYLNGRHELKVKLLIDPNIRWKFVCKVALATGYFLFGDLFEQYADCSTLRKVILSDEDELRREKLDLRLYTNLTPINESDQIMHALNKKLFEYLGVSLVNFGYATGRILASVAINGKYIGTVNFKADVDRLLPPKDDLHRGGCILMCKDNKLIKKSFWQSIYDMNEELKLVDLDAMKKR